MEKSVWDKKQQCFIKKEFIALCNSRGCIPIQIYRAGPYKVRRYDDFKFVKKDVSEKTVHCPDCGSVLLWKQQE